MPFYRCNPIFCWPLSAVITFLYLSLSTRHICFRMQFYQYVAPKPYRGVITLFCSHMKPYHLYMCSAVSIKSIIDFVSFAYKNNMEWTKKIKLQIDQYIGIGASNTWDDSRLMKNLLFALIEMFYTGIKNCL